MNHLPSRSSILDIRTEDEFNALALQIFSYQREQIPAYARFLRELNRPGPLHWSEIPCLPIAAFKEHEIIDMPEQSSITFTSSGTTGATTSSHHVRDEQLYRGSFMRHIEQRYGQVADWAIIGLLPAYLERSGSSLIYMVDALIKASDHTESGFYLDEFAQLHSTLATLRDSGTPTLLIGVTFALLDFAEQHPIAFPELIVMETGGMKGRRKELIREELHDLLSAGFGVKDIHSEYGMTEMLSQAYSLGKGLHHAPAWMRAQVRDVYDPLTMVKTGASGGLNVYDLANMHSCSFIATDDLSRQYEDGSFEVLGRFDQSDVRGCSLLV